MTKTASAIPDLRKTDAEWRNLLTPEQYHITRKAGTERPFSSPSHNDERNGNYHCVCCDTPMFSSHAKFNSGTGWPSFFQPMDGNAIIEREDQKLFTQRTEILCAACEAHLGHVFPDGPKPTGLRYCINGLALCFRPR